MSLHAVPTRSRLRAGFFVSLLCLTTSLDATAATLDTATKTLDATAISDVTAATFGTATGELAGFCLTATRYAIGSFLG